MLIVPRTCLPQPQPDDEQAPAPIPLSDTRAVTAYALLGDPGSGKSKSFEQEAAAAGTFPISASDFLTFDHPQLLNAEFPIFIDGLDETRAGTSNGIPPLDGIRRKLKQLGCRRFRISCRAADWLGQPDAQRLQSLLPDGETVEVFTLQPLTVEDVTAILAANHGIADPRAFIAMAGQHGVTDLLFNPQTLSMLAKAVGPNNQWPETRLAVYTLACARLAQEHNEEHVAATLKSAPDQDRLLRAASYLCAIQLVADIAGFTHSPNPPERVLRLNEIPNPEGLPLGEALSTRIIKTLGADAFAPVHRTVAEFLAARCLADKLQDKLTLRRIRSLICGMDGGIVTGMRGLAGWLASMSPAARSAFIRLDSLGVLLYGDARDFSVADKSALMDQLGSDIAVATSFRWHDREGRPFAALVSPDMRTLVARRLEAAERSEDQQLLVLALLEGLKLAQADPVLAPLLLAMARDDSRWQTVRLRALHLYRGWVGVTHPSLQLLLDDVAAGIIPDNDDEVLGSLLTVMYPAAIPSANLPRYFHRPKKDSLVGNYRMFWRRNLEQVGAADLPDMLDAFASRTDLHKDDRLREYAASISALLLRVLKNGVDGISDERLLNWFDAACGQHNQSLLEGNHKVAVQQWVDAHPERYYALLDLALTRYAGSGHRIWHAQARFHDARAPGNEAAWWLAKAEATAEDATAKTYFMHALQALSYDDAPMLGELLPACERLAALRGWQDVLSEVLFCSFEHWGWKREDYTRSQEEKAEIARRRDAFRSRLAEFSLDNVPLDILNTIAEVYEHRGYDIHGDTPLERLANLFGDDEELVTVALPALRRTYNRGDLPSAEQILQAEAEGQRMLLHVPALISVELAYRYDPAFLDSISDERLINFLVAHLVRPVEGHGTWVDAALESRPGCMAEAMRLYLASALKSKGRSPRISHLLREPAYAKATRQILLPLLAKFPLHARKNLCGTLDDMLHAALALLAREDILPLVRIRIDAAKVDGPQRASWLAVGLVLDPEQYLPVAQCYLARRAHRIERLAEFLHDRRVPEVDRFALTPAVVGFLIEKFAAGNTPAHPASARWVGPKIHAAELATRFLNDLAGKPDPDCTKQLARLQSLPAISEWLPRLREARAAQQVVRRDTTYERPTWLQVCTALQQGPPSSSAEIAAVVNDTIEVLKDDIRRGDLDLKLDYWNADAHRKATTPKHEELCRNTFTGQLRPRLERFGIACFPETRHAEEKRSDLWCTIGQAGVPIEVKRDRHAELWTATRGQLIARYTGDPRAGGFGIYMVFWFGEPATIAAPPTGKRPSTPEELQAMLEAGLSESERRLITIHVIDCSVRQGKP